MDTRGAEKSHGQGVASFWVSSGEGEFISGMGGCARHTQKPQGVKESGKCGDPNHSRLNGGV